MKKVWNKETRNSNGKYYRECDWGVEVYDSFKADNFTEISPPKEMLNGAPGDWVNGEWVLDKIDSKYDDYIKDQRRKEYPAIGDQLDAIWKQLMLDRDSGVDLIADADAILDACLAVKIKYPKAK